MPLKTCLVYNLDKDIIEEFKDLSDGGTLPMRLYLTMYTNTEYPEKFGFKITMFECDEMIPKLKET